jgi:hypothetical protein
MPDGTAYAGGSPETGKAMYVAPADAPLTMKWAEAIAYAEKFDGNGHRDWRVPSAAELKVLYNDRAAIGGFKCGYLFSRAQWYWSSTVDSEFHELAHVRRFGDGCHGWWLKSDGGPYVRLVRG